MGNTDMAAQMVSDSLAEHYLPVYEQIVNRY